MSSRQHEKERRRQERIAREQEQAAAVARRRRLQIAGGAVVVVAAIVVAIVLATSGNGSNQSKSTPTAPQPAGAGARAGIQTTRAPWSPEYMRLATRLDALHFPGQSDAGFHIHAELRVFANGHEVPVPADIGIDPNGQFISPLHTHDTSGVIHMEATGPYPFTLGQFFTVWGVAFSADQLGAYHDGRGGRVQAYVDGKRIANPASYVMKPHDSIIVGYGKPGSFPKKLATTFAPGL